MSNLKNNQPATSIGILFVCVIFFIIFLVFKCSCSQSDSDKKQQIEQQKISKEKDLKIAALTYAQISVEERLLSPGSAEFPWGIDCVKKIKDNTYIISSYVDSQNSFGAMLRTKFICQITLTGNDTYTCDNIQLFEQ